MKLIIREYLSLLKESNELDQLLPDLLLAMDIEPISRTQTGVRQYGVDVAAVGIDEDGKKTLFLFTIKQGDIGRTDWDAREQSVRQSLDEIKDVYLTTHILPEHKSLKKKIIVCTGGELKQEVQLNWKGYVERNSIAGKVEYDFWGGDKLSILIEKYIFNEHLLPEKFRSKFRKTLSLLSDPDYNLSDYYNILDELLIKPNYSNIDSQATQKKIKKILRTVHLGLNIIIAWARNEKNLKPAVYVAERTVLDTWEFLRRNNLFKKKAILSIFYEIYLMLFSLYAEYTKKIQKHCYLEDGLHINGQHYLLECLNVFEQLGIVSLLGIAFVFQAFIEKNKSLMKSASAILNTIKALIENHLSTRTPCYDNHIIEISLSLYLLHIFNEKDFAKKWIEEIINHISFAYYQMGKYFPIWTDSFDDLVSLNISEQIDKEKMFEISTLIPILAQWCIVYDFKETYQIISETANKVFKNCTFQIWYPDNETDKYLYIVNAAYKSGNVEAPILLDDGFDKMRKIIEAVQTNTIKPDQISSIKYGFQILPMIASRHFRTPMLPFYWQKNVIETKS